MNENDVKALALFFFYICLDDQTSTHLASKAADLLAERHAKSEKVKNSVATILCAQKIFEKYRGQLKRGRPHYSADSGWLLPENLDLSAWKEFQKSAPEDELICVIWSKIVKMSDDDISAALGLSVGTVRYRVGRGLKKLGAMVQAGGRKNFQVVR